MSPPVIRLRASSAGLLSLPWAEPLAEWQPTEVPLRDLPVGPSRHLVRFAEVDGHMFALKELPPRIAHKEYRVLRELEVKGLPAVRAVGLVEQPDLDSALLVTDYLEKSWQYRRLLMRIPPTQRKHRDRLLDAMAALLVDLHRAGVFWGDCSLANTLFMRDGQRLQAHLVDAETSEVHPALSDGQRDLDLSLVVENVAGGLVDLGARLEQPPEMFSEYFQAAESVRTRYQALWAALHPSAVLGYDERTRVESQIRALNDLGFALDEVRLVPSRSGTDALRLEVSVAGPWFHAQQLQELTGLRVMEGQARVLLNDLRAYQTRLERSERGSAPDAVIGDRWLEEVFRPAVRHLQAEMGSDIDPVQTYCDLLEVRWLLSEEAGYDVTDDIALPVLAVRAVPRESAASMRVAEDATSSFPALTDEVLAEMGAARSRTGDDPEGLRVGAPSRPS